MWESEGIPDNKSRSNLQEQQTCREGSMLSQGRSALRGREWDPEVYRSHCWVDTACEPPPSWTNGRRSGPCALLGRSYLLPSFPWCAGISGEGKDFPLPTSGYQTKNLGSYFTMIQLGMCFSCYKQRGVISQGIIGPKQLFINNNREKIPRRGPQLYWSKAGRPKSWTKENLSVRGHFPMK